MSLHARIRKLERQGGPSACPGCGWGGGGPIRLVVNAPLVAQRLDRERAAEHARERPGDFCGACGRKLVLRVPSPMLARAGGGR